MQLSLTHSLFSPCLSLFLCSLPSPPSSLPEINLKEELIHQLEKGQKDLRTMGQQYEEGVSLLHSKIKDLETETSTSVI